MSPVVNCNPASGIQHKLASLYGVLFNTLQKRVDLIVGGGEGNAFVTSSHKFHLPILEHS